MEGGTEDFPAGRGSDREARTPDPGFMGPRVLVEGTGNEEPWSLEEVTSESHAGPPEG